MQLSENITLNLSFPQLLSIVGIVVVALGALTYYVVRLNVRVKKLTPQYGFAGKKIVNVALIAFVAGAAPLLTLLAMNSTEIRRQAAEVEDVVISASIVEREEGSLVVGFSIVPFENGIAWGEKIYNVTWEVTGPSPFTFIEQEVSKTNPSYITKSVLPGQYEITVHVTGDKFELDKTSIFNLE